MPGTTQYHTRPGWKTCTACREEKQLGDFYRNRGTGDGLTHWCRACTKWKTTEAKIIQSVERRQAEEMEPPELGFCRAFVDLGGSWMRVHCSRRVKARGYCLTHLPAELRSDYAKHGNRWEQEAIIEAIQSYRREHGALPTAEGWKKPGPWPNYKTVARQFGSWANAVEAAGFERPRRGVYLGDRRKSRGPYKKAAFPRPGSELWKLKEAAIESGMDAEVAQLLVEQARDARRFQEGKPWELSLNRSMYEEGDPMIAFVNEHGEFCSPRHAISATRDAAWVDPLLALIDEGLSVDELLEAA